MVELIYRSAINDPHQCRLCLRVCDDTFLESIFSEKEEYGIAHQIFECTSIRVTKQDNLTKICSNCAALLFITTEFRNACFKTNRLLMEDFVILEVGEWTEEGNRSTLKGCSELIVKHKQQVDYLYASVVPDSESYLEGSLEIERELFDSERRSMAMQLGTEKIATNVDQQDGLLKGTTTEFEPEEPDPEIIQEITKFLEGQHSTEENEGFCMICSLDVAKKLSGNLSETLGRYFKSLYRDDQTMRICEVCRQTLEWIAMWHSIIKKDATSASNRRKISHKLSSIKDTQRHLLKQFQELKRQLNSNKPLKGTSKTVKTSKRKRTDCHLCGKQFDSWKMKAHLNEHENKKPYVCNQPGCTSAFSAVDLLNRHRKLWHTDYFYKSCPTCGKKCKTQGIYKTHVSYHEQPTLPCEICGKLMRNKRSMWKHMKSHQSPEEREHVCDECGKRFAMAYTLRVHRRIHTNEKPYGCDRCQKQFQYKCLLKAHVEKCVTKV